MYVHYLREGAKAGKWKAMLHAEHTDMSTTERYLDPAIAYPATANTCDLLPEV